MRNFTDLSFNGYLGEGSRRPLEFTGNVGANVRSEQRFGINGVIQVELHQVVRATAATGKFPNRGGLSGPGGAFHQDGEALAGYSMAVINSP